MPGETGPASACLLPQQKPMLVAELLGGGFQLDSAPGHGVTVQMYWPLIEEATE